MGPMARDVETLAIAMKALLIPLMFQLDRSVPPITFKSEVWNAFE
jgi:fatty acid amide hydrolase